MAESEEERILTRIPTSFDPALVHPFSFPAYKSPDTKDDMVLHLILFMYSMFVCQPIQFS